MPATTAWERKNRRREVVRLRAQGMSTEEIAEELGWGERTIKADLEHLNKELSKWDDGDYLRRMLRDLANELYEQEFEDLRRADREGDEQAKHRAKTSARQTIELIEKLEKDFFDTGPTDTDSWFDELSDDLRAELADEAGKAVEDYLKSE